MDNQYKTVLIIGANSSIGGHLADIFIQNKWEVFATSRKKPKIAKAENIKIDLEKQSSIEKGIRKVLRKTIKIDLLINATGIVYSGPIESFTMNEIRHQMEVNFFGAVNVIKQVLPKMRERKEGTIVNISSLCGLVAFPMLSIYHASKWALEGFTESIYFELQSLGIKVKLIVPGGIKSDKGYANINFAQNSIADYQSLLQSVHKTNWFPSFSSPKEIATQIFNASTDDKTQLRYVLGDESMQFLNERYETFNRETYLSQMKSRFLKE